MQPVAGHQRRRPAPTVEARTHDPETVLTGGKEDILAHLLGVVRPGDRVAVKPNCAWDRKPSQAANTDPELVGEHRARVLELADLIVPEDLAAGHVTGRVIEPRDFDVLLDWRVDYEVNTIGCAGVPTAAPWRRPPTRHW